MKLRVAAGGALAWLPQETILFDRARAASRGSRSISPTTRALVLAEALVFGRTGMGEAVRTARCTIAGACAATAG